MVTAYSPILKLALPVQGELSGTWGDVVNDNITSMVEQAIAGRAVIDTWVVNSHTLTTANGTTSESRCAMLELTDTGVALTGAGTVICPTASKIYVVKNASGQNITVKTAAGTGVLVPNGRTTFLFCDGTNVLAAMTHTTSLELGTSTVVTAVLDEDNMASNSATSLATQQSIKAYVDAQVSANNELSEVLANGNTTGGNDILFGDNDKAVFGAGSNLQIYSDGTNSFIKETSGPGSLIFNADFFTVQNVAGTETKLVAKDNGEVALYYNNLEKLATTATGVDVTGTVTADGLTVDGGTLLRQTSTNSVGLDFQNSAGQFDLVNTNNYLRFRAGAAQQEVLQVGATGDISFYEDTGTTAKFFWDASAESLGIGTSLPAQTLHINSAGGVSSAIKLTNGNSGTAITDGFSITQASDGVNNSIWNYEAGYTRFGTSNTERMRIDASGNVGIGTSSPATALDVTGTVTADGLTVGAANPTILLKDTDSAGTAASAAIRFADSADTILGQMGYLSGSNSDFDIIQSANAAIDVWTNATQRMSIEANGDISFYEDTGTTAKFFWDASAESLGIGTAAPATLLHLAANNAGITTAGTGNNTLRFEDNDPTKIAGQVTGTIDWYTNDVDATGVQAWITADSSNVGAGALAFGTGVAGAATERLRIDASGNVGIGETSPDVALHVNSGAVNNVAKFHSTDLTASIYLTDGSTTGGDAGVQGLITTGDNLEVRGLSSVILATGTTDRLTIDAVGNVGIGTASPDKRFEVQQQGDNDGIRLSYPTRTGLWDIELSGLSSDALVFHQNNGSTSVASTIMRRSGHEWLTDGTERMRINSSGNVLVGKTSDNAAISGSILNGNGDTYLTAEGARGRVLYLNRLTSDGTIIDLRKNGAPVGSIGVQNNYLTIGKNDTGLKFQDGVDGVHPWDMTSNAARDAAIDIGYSTNRFKDLYLSGGVYLGGTGAANKLDDVETGTWSPIMPTEGGTNYTLSSTTAKYTKVGNVVTVEAEVVYTSRGSGTITLVTLPFAAESSLEVLQGWLSNGNNRRSVQLLHYSGTLVLLRWDNGSSFINYWTPSNEFAASGTFSFSGTYRTS